MNLLIVDDHPTNLKLLRAQLEAEGHAVFEARDGVDALALLERQPVDAVISDILMPRMDGYRFCHEIRKHARLHDLPIILCTSTYTSPGDEKLALHVGADKYLKSPVSVETLVAALHEVIAMPHAAPQPKALQEIEVLKEYSERLVSKLEERNTELMAAEVKFRTLVEQSIVGIYMIQDDQFVYVNPRMAGIFGRSEEEMTSRTLYDFLVPEDHALARENIRKRISGGVPSIHYYLRMLHQSGAVLQVEVHSSRADYNGRPAVMGMLLDITERKRAEERMRAILESALDCIITMDHEGRVVEFNPSAENTFGYERNEAVGHLLAELIIPPSLREKYQHGLSHYLATGAGPVLGKRIEITAMRRDGSEFPVELAITRIGLQDPPMFTGFIRDITERKHAIERLQEQADIINRAHDAIVVRDFESERITLWNAGAERLYGWSVAEAIGRPIGELLFVDPTDREAPLKLLVTTGEFHGELKHITKDGKEIIVDARVTLVRDSEGSPRSVLTINTDITEQKTLETQLLRAQRLESIGTLASGVAHDLNNILTPILMGAAVLRRTEMPAADEAILSTIETCAQRGADIVKQVLTFARGAEGARLSLQPAHLIKDMGRITEETFPKTITVRTGFSESLWPIEGDPTQLHQVLLNLSVNARDAMPAGGTLTISAENFEVDEHYASMTPGAKAGPHVLFQVIDTGMGIPRQIIDKIFDPFFTTKELGHGTGLGLSTTIGIVKSHGGFVSVYSEIGRGTTLKVFLPAKVGELAGVEQPAATALPPANGELLLIVDDEKPILQVAQALLEGHGYQVLTAGDAAEALAIFATRMEEIKLVLTDLAMPFMDGIALIRTLQKMKPDVKVIASTGLGGQEEHANDFAALNVRACLTKPYNKDKLLTTLRDALGPQTDKQ